MQKNKKMTPAERFGKTAGEHIHSVADSLAIIVGRITESKEHKEWRLAHEVVGKYTSNYLRKQFDGEKPYNPPEDYEKSQSLRDALDVLKVSKEEWLKDCQTFLKLSKILYYKNSCSFYNNTQFDNKWALDNDKDLQASLKYFNVRTEDWLKFGTKILELYDLFVSKGPTTLFYD